MDATRRGSRIYEIAYLLVGAAVLWGQFEGLSWLRFFFKPLIMVILLLWSLATPDLRTIKKKNLFLIAMIFAGIGDTFLMSESYFLPGLAAFLVMQVLYTIVFLPEIRRPLNVPLVKIALVALILIFMLSIVYPHLNDPALKIAVPVYAISISAMVLAASFRNFGVSRKSFQLVLVGAALFMVSDSLIAYTSFVEPVAGQAFWIMTTYMVAQYFIVAGILKVR